MLPHAPYRSPRQFRCVEMNYADILLHKKEGARLLPPPSSYYVFILYLRD
jgi:hypothetical protein